jgi:hypothetical protein
MAGNTRKFFDRAKWNRLSRSVVGQSASGGSSLTPAWILVKECSRHEIQMQEPIIDDPIPTKSDPSSARVPGADVRLPQSTDHPQSPDKSLHRGIVGAGSVVYWG